MAGTSNTQRRTAQPTAIATAADASARNGNGKTFKAQTLAQPLRPFAARTVIERA